ncbi:DUF1642 domain-containing protein [Enterococcus durans]|uniref:DUF1642 domain-containing protein n=1 Tax=Enterococcus durans TaxID=53345 RepID=UPI0039A590EA
MDKQELIDKLARLVGSMEDFKGISTFYDGKYAGLEHALELIQQLDEPHKPVVPKFVAEWFEGNKHALDLAIFIAIRRGLDEEEWPHKTDFENWLDVSKNKPIETLIRMKDGYEVEKEPLYSVIIAGEYLVKEISCSDEVKLVSTAYLPQYLAHHYQLTEKQIKEIDERYWPFAVPVEEVTER